MFFCKYRNQYCSDKISKYSDNNKHYLNLSRIYNKSAKINTITQKAIFVFLSLKADSKDLVNLKLVIQYAKNIGTKRKTAIIN